MSTHPPGIPVRLWAVAAITGSGAFMAMLDSTVANLAITSIGAGFGAPLADVQWVATGYLIALAVSLPLTGWLGRRFGRGRLWAASTLAFVIASVSCALARDLAQLTASRCLQGLAAGLMVPAGQAVLSAATDRRQLGRLMGTVGFAVSLGPALGPGLGGVLIEAVSWRWLFWINVPVGVLALATARFVVPPGEARSSGRPDVAGLALIGPGLPLLLYGAAGIGAVGFTGPSTAGAALGAVLTAGFMGHTLRSASPLIDVRLFGRPGFAAAVATAGLTGAAMYGGLLLLPLFLQGGLHQTPTESGLMLLAMGLGSAFALPLAGTFTDRYGAAPVCSVGSAVLLLSTVPFLFGPTPPAAGVAALLFLRGAGLALAQMPAMTAAYGAVAESETGDAATLINMFQHLGGALGAIATVVVLEQGSRTGEAAGYRWAFVVLTAFAIGSFVTGLLLARPDAEPAR